MYHLLLVALAVIPAAAPPTPGVLPDAAPTDAHSTAWHVAPSPMVARATERGGRTDLGVKAEGLNVTLPLAPSKTEKIGSGRTAAYWFETEPLGPLVFTVLMKRSGATTAVARSFEHDTRIRRYVTEIEKAGCGNIRRKDAPSRVSGRGSLPPTALRITCGAHELLVHFYSGAIWNLTISIAADEGDLADHAETISDVVGSIRVP